MGKSLREYITVLGYWGLIVIASISFDVIGAYQLVSGNQFIDIPSWVWFQIAFVLLLIIPFIAFHKLRVQRDEARGAEKLLVLTPHKYAIGLSGMTGYPKEPDNADWLRLEVAVNPIDKPIDKLDLLIGDKKVPANHWPGKNVAAFNAYFNIIEWRRKGKNQVELIACVEGRGYSSGRITIDFNIEPGVIGHLI